MILVVKYLFYIKCIIYNKKRKVNLNIILMYESKKQKVYICNTHQ